MTAVMMTAARLALGMKAQYGIITARHRMTSPPVITMILTSLYQWMITKMLSSTEMVLLPV